MFVNKICNIDIAEKTIKYHVEAEEIILTQHHVCHKHKVPVLYCSIFYVLCSMYVNEAHSDSEKFGWVKWLATVLN